MDSRQRGHTLTESMAALAVLGIVLSTAASTVGDIVQGLRLQAHTGDLVQHLMLARSEAIKRNARVVLCKSADGAACSDNGGWEQGWILFQDANNSGTLDAHERVLQRLPPLPPGWRVGGNAPVARYVAYGPYGVTQLRSGAFQAGTFTICSASAAGGEARQVVINAGGRPRVQKTWVDSCY